MLARFLERFRLTFFRWFLPLLLAAIAASEWVILVRVARRFGVAVPGGMHALAPVGLFVVNRALAARLRVAPGGRIASAYAAFAFTCVFGGVLVGVAELAWALARLGAVPAVRAAGVVPVALTSGWEPTFEALVDLGLLGLAGLFLFGYTGGRHALVTSLRRVPVHGLAPSLDGFRIVHLSDLHVGAFLGLAELREHVARVNALAPDLICITGDLVDRVETCETAFPVLAGLRARHGVLVTLGNHDVAAGADAVAAALRSLTPFTVLRNARVELASEGWRLVIVGLDDLGRDWARGVREHPALPGLVEDVPDGAPLIVLTHRPDCFEQAADAGASLVLAGHTHGGQLALPTLGARRIRNLAEFITRYDRGVFRRGVSTLIVSNGLGFTGQPVRLFTPREIGRIELGCA